MMRDIELEEEAKQQIADRYTAYELVELLEIPVEDIIEEYWHLILDKGLVSALHTEG